MAWRPLPEATQAGEVYVLHFDRPVGTERQQALHYVGFARDASSRIAEHRRGRGSRLTQVLKERGGSFVVAQVLAGTRADEQRLKNRGGGARVCAVCRGKEVAL